MKVWSSESQRKGHIHSSCITKIIKEWMSAHMLPFACRTQMQSPSKGRGCVWHGASPLGRANGAHPHENSPKQSCQDQHLDRLLSFSKLATSSVKRGYGQPQRVAERIELDNTHEMLNRVKCSINTRYYYCHINTLRMHLPAVHHFKGIPSSWYL